MSARVSVSRIRPWLKNNPKYSFKNVGGFFVSKLFSLGLSVFPQVSLRRRENVLTSSFFIFLPWINKYSQSTRFLLSPSAPRIYFISLILFVSSFVRILFSLLRQPKSASRRLISTVLIYTTPCFPALWQQLFGVNIDMSATPLFHPTFLCRNYMYQFLGREITTQHSPLLRKLWQCSRLPEVESIGYWGCGSLTYSTMLIYVWGDICCVSDRCQLCHKWTGAVWICVCYVCSKGQGRNYKK